MANTVSARRECPRCSRWACEDLGCRKAITALSSGRSWRTESQRTELSGSLLAPSRAVRAGVRGALPWAEAERQRYGAEVSQVALLPGGPRVRPVTGVRGSPREGRSTDGGSRAKAGAPPVPHPAGPHPLGAGGAADASRVPGAAVAALLRGPRPPPRTPLRRRGCPDQRLPARAAPARLRAEGAAFRTAGVSCPRSGVARGGRTGARGAPWGPAPRGTAPADRGPAGRRRAGGSVSPSLRPPVPAAAAARPPHGETRPRPRPRSARPRRPPTLARCRPGSRLVPRGQGRRAGRGRRAVSGAGDAFPGVPLGATGRDRAAGEGEGGRESGRSAVRDGLGRARAAVT